MKNIIYNEKNGLWYEKHGDYYLHSPSLPEDETQSIPKIFWKYFDLYRRKKITLYQYSESTGLPIHDIEKFLKEITGGKTKAIENTKQL